MSGNEQSIYDLLKKSIQKEEYIRFSKGDSCSASLNINAVFINTTRYSMITDPALLHYVKSDTTVKELNSYLNGLFLQRRHVIPMQVLSNLHHLGLIYQHLQNDRCLVDGNDYMIVKMICKRMNLLASPYKSIVVFAVFKLTKDDLLQSTYNQRVCPQIKAGSDGVLIKPVVVSTHSAPIIPADRPAVFAYYSDMVSLPQPQPQNQAKDKDKNKNNNNQNQTTDSAENEILMKIKKKNEERSKMDSHIRESGILYNWFYTVADITAKEEIYSLPFCN
jgi:hypothetical protein